MRKVLLFLLPLLAISPLLADWSQTASDPTLIAGFAGEQVIPKVSVTPDGNVYVARFDNGSGNYDVYLQLFSQSGQPLWPQPAGVQVSAFPSMTWLTDWDMDTDPEGRAVLVWQDIRSNNVNNVVAYQVNDQGQLTWGANGIALSSDTSDQYSNMSPTVFCSADNSSYFAWQRMASSTTVVLQRLSSTGQKLWGENGITLTSTVGSITWPQIIQADGNNVLVKYYEDSGPFWAPNRHLYVAKYNPEGTRLWNTVITNAGGISAWQQVLPFESDGAGGAVLAWYDDRYSDMVNEVYAQRVGSDGVVSMTANGVQLASGNNYQYYYPELAVDHAAQRIFAFFRITDPDQNNAGLAGQLLDFQGTIYWGDSGLGIYELSSTANSTVGAYMTDFGAVLVYERGAVPQNDQLMHLQAKWFRASGPSGLPGEFVEIASDNTNKLHFHLDVNRDDWMVLAWESGTNGNDIYAMRLNRDGTLGMQYMPPQNLSAELVPPNGVHLAWNAPSIYWDPQGYRLFMDNEMLQALPGNQTIYDVSPLSPGEHSFHAIAVYGDGLYSGPSNTVTVMIVPNDDPAATVPPIKLTVEPNPVRSHARILYSSNSGANRGMLRIYNIRGQKVFEKAIDLDKGNTELILGEDIIRPLSSGLHIVEISSGQSRVRNRMLLLK